MYLAQLDRLQVKVKRLRREKVALLHDNPRPHIEHRVVESTDSMGWELVPYPPYSLTEAPTYFHVNRSLKNWQACKIYENFDQLVADVKAWIASKDRHFFARELIDFQANGRQLLNLTVNMLRSDLLYMLSMYINVLFFIINISTFHIFI